MNVVYNYFRERISVKRGNRHFQLLPSIRFEATNPNTSSFR